MPKKAKRWEGRVFTGRVDGKPTYVWVGRFDSKKERDAAVHEAAKQLKGGPSQRFTCAEWADRYLSRYEREHKLSSVDTAKAALRRFKRDFGSRRLDSITRLEAEDWSLKVPAGVTAVAISCFNSAVDLDVLDRNPFRGLSRKGKGRSETNPPTEEEFDRLLQACDVLGDYGPYMRNLLTFAAFTGMRPGELFALEFGDVDMDARRVHVRRRVYRGRLDTPKSGKARTIAVPPPARDALLRQDQYHEGGRVFGSKHGRMLSQPTLSGYWKEVCARAGLKFDFYLATKHRAVHHLYVELGLPPHVVAAQMGWQLKGTIALLETYAHHSIGALDAIDQAFTPKVTPLRVASTDSA